MLEFYKNNNIHFRSEYDMDNLILKEKEFTEENLNYFTKLYMKKGEYTYHDCCPFVLHLWYRNKYKLLRSAILKCPRYKINEIRDCIVEILQGKIILKDFNISDDLYTGTSIVSK